MHPIAPRHGLSSILPEVVGYRSYVVVASRQTGSSRQ